MKIKEVRPPYPGDEEQSWDSDEVNSWYDQVLNQLSPDEMERRRTFNTEERTVLLILADGRCQKCNAVLGEDWEADHVVPFSKGGLTDVTNGQALCRSCNRKKGAR